MILIVGLGNSGHEFERTRHNTGFWAVERLAEVMRTEFRKEEKFHSLIARPNDKECLLAKPQTFMNRSGDAVAAIAQFYKIQSDHIWVIYDDVDLPVGTARARERGLGRTRHKGLLSVATTLGTHAFPRFRIGIARAAQNMEAADRPREPVELKSFVLAPFDRRELPLVEKVVTWVVNEIVSSLKKGRVVSRTLTKGL